MDRERKIPALLIYFLIALIALFLSVTLFPNIRLLTFAPFFAIVFQKKNFLNCLWIATLCGLLVDILSSDLHFGSMAFCSFATTFVTFNLKKYFYEDKFFSIPLYTALISATFSAIQLILIRNQIPLNFQTICSSLVIMPLVDALYGLVWFTCPKMVYSALKRIRG